MATFTSGRKSTAFTICLLECREALDKRLVLTTKSASMPVDTLKYLSCNIDHRAVEFFRKDPNDAKQYISPVSFAFAEIV